MKRTFYKTTINMFDLKTSLDDFGATIGDRLFFVKTDKCNAQQANADLIMKEFGKALDADVRVTMPLEGNEAIGIKHYIILSGNRFDGITQFQVTGFLNRDSHKVILAKQLDRVLDFDVVTLGMLVMNTKTNKLVFNTTSNRLVKTIGGM